MKYFGKSEQGVHPLRVHALIFLFHPQVPKLHAAASQESFFLSAHGSEHYMWMRGMFAATEAEPSVRTSTILKSAIVILRLCYIFVVKTILQL